MGQLTGTAAMGLLDDVRRVFEVEGLYALLKVGPTCSPQQLKKAYFHCARAWHPDKAEAANKAVRAAAIRHLSLSL
jgi:curved DNA-binding protein CbpA